MFRQAIGALLLLSIAGSMLGLARQARAQTNTTRSVSIVHRINSENERQEMTVNTSRILTLDRKIPQAQVNNPEILDLTPLSPTDIQLSAKKAGVTQVNLWDEENNIYTVDVVVSADTRELSMILREEFPNASLKVRGIADGVLISGYVDQPQDVQSIIQISETYYPQKVSTRLQVGGVQQVLLHVKVMEVSRTKLRALGFDWVNLTSSSQIVSAAAGIITGFDPGDATTAPAVDHSPAGNFRFNVVSGSNSFFGLLEAMRRDNMAKLLAEPTLVTVSGRPASFLSGGEVPVTTGGGVGVPPNTVYKKYGTRIDFVPIVLGNGQIRLEVRPSVSEIDGSRSSSTGAPAFSVREVDTGVEMEAGQTLAIAGLIQNRIEAERRGLPWVSELPYVGAAFRHVGEEMNEIELLILVTPEIVSAMDAEQVPPCGPGMRTTSPSDWELYMKGHLEVPNCCANCGGSGCTSCDAAMSGQFMPGMIERGEGRILQPGEILLPQQPAAPRPVPQPQTAPLLPAVPRPDASAMHRSTTARPVGPAVVNNPAAIPVSNRVPTTSRLPGLIGPIGYDSPQ